MVDMENPFDNIENAFEPFFNETVMVGLKGSALPQTVKAFVATDNTADPLSDEMLETECDAISVVIRKSDWQSISRIKRGDYIARTNPAKTYNVTGVQEDFALGFVIHARTM